MLRRIATRGIFLVIYLSVRAIDMLILAVYRFTSWCRRHWASAAGIVAGLRGAGRAVVAMLTSRPRR